MEHKLLSVGALALLAVLENIRSSVLRKCARRLCRTRTMCNELWPVGNYCHSPRA